MVAEYIAVGELLAGSASCMSEEAAPAKRTRAAEALDPDTDTAAESHEACTA